MLCFADGLHGILFVEQVISLAEVVSIGNMEDKSPPTIVQESSARGWGGPDKWSGPESAACQRLTQSWPDSLVWQGTGRTMRHLCQAGVRDRDIRSFSTRACECLRDFVFGVSAMLRSREGRLGRRVEPLFFSRQDCLASLSLNG